MPATGPYNNRMSDAKVLQFTVAPGTTIHGGTMVALNTNGQAVPAVPTAGFTVVGRAEGSYSAGEKCLVRQGAMFLYKNSTQDAIPQSKLGKVCFVEDDVTVREVSAVVNGTAAGKVMGFEEGEAYVWVWISV